MRKLTRAQVEEIAKTKLKDLTAADLEGDVLHGAGHPRAPRHDVVRAESVDLQQLHSWRSCGSSFTRSQSPRRLAESTMSMMQVPGKTVSHQ